ncbi:Gfo/Idh/MocA family oxidoreductase [Chloroflexota bacterium]
MDKLLKVGVIGVGSMGQHHARVYSEQSGVKLVGIADIDIEKASGIARKYNTNSFADYQKLLNQGLDGVSITVPTSCHREIALAVADAKVNMLVEKPLADTVDSAREITYKCEEKGVLLMVGHIERFNPIIPVIKRSMEKTNVISIDITRVGPLPPRITDVGVMIDLAVHDIDLVRYLTGSEFKKTHALTSKSLSSKEDIALLSLEMENGILAHITTNWLTPFKVREISVFTREKLIKGWFIEQRVLEYSTYEEDGSYVVRELKIPYGEPLKLEIEAFIRSVRHNENPPITGYDGIKSIEVVSLCTPTNEKV